jgi:4-aminobutyrate aminotransferase/(S)-3-amino-2-methylpropionate transaminase
MTKSSELKSRRDAAVAKGVATRTIYAERAENAELWDADGRRFIDFAAGIAVNNAGHRHPRLMEAVATQAEAFTHTCFHVAPFEGYVRLAERLNAATPGDFGKKTMLATTGAEAVENAVKMARAYTGRSGVIAFSGAFHGRTLMGMALCGKVAPYKKSFGAMPPEVFHAPFPNTFHGVTPEQSLAELDRLFKSSVDPERVAAMIIEPVQGEGGFNIADYDFLHALRRIATEHGVVLIADEVQAGMARTGKLFAFEHAGVAADLVTMAKGLAGGFPLSAVTAPELGSFSWEDPFRLEMPADRGRAADPRHGGGLCPGQAAAAHARGLPQETWRSGDLRRDGRNGAARRDRARGIWRRGRGLRRLRAGGARDRARRPATAR